MILRFRTREGMFRVEVDSQATFAQAISLLSPQLPPHVNLQVAAGATEQPTGETEQWQQSLESLGLKHGTMLFASYEKAIDLTDEAKPVEPTEPQLEGIDKELANDPGKIPRTRSSMCRHGERGMCEYCQPLEPWDDEYCAEQGIKHHSFYAHLRKTLADAPTSTKHVLEEPVYSVAPNCRTGHAPWPEGQCSKCQPSAITLLPQTWRAVDHVEFSSADIMNRFIEYWRATSCQRFGILLGRYERYDKVPLGVKAVVYAIYEPEQENYNDGIKFNWDLNSSVLQAASALQLQPVGVVTSDLTDAGKKDGSVLYKRHRETYFLSSLEIALAANLQLKFPLKTPFSATGFYSSRFVTCIVSGNEEGQIDVSCFQVSTQAEAMAKAGLLEACANPSVMRIKPPTRTRFVPEVFYKHFNEYGLAVRSDAKPSFPNDYLIVSLTHGFPETPTTSLHATFPIENRRDLRMQTPAQVVDALRNCAQNPATLADFHLLRYLLSFNAFDPEDYEHLRKALDDLLNSGDPTNVRAFLQTDGVRKLIQMA